MSLENASKLASDPDRLNLVSRLDEMERVTARELAMLRYRRRHEHMEEIFSPVSIAELPKSPEPYGHLDAAALEKQVVSVASVVARRQCR